MLLYRTMAEKGLLGIWFYYYAKLERHFAIVLYTNVAVSSREWKPRVACVAGNLAFLHLKWERPYPNNPAALWDLYCHWSLWLVASIVIMFRGIVCLARLLFHSPITGCMWRGKGSLDYSCSSYRDQYFYWSLWPAAVIAVAPTSKASFVYSYVQTRLKGQYNGKWPFGLVYVLKPLINAIRANGSWKG